MNEYPTLDVDFVRCLESFETEYGEDIAKLNGFADSQINYTEFIDNFIDNDGSVADASIDGNSNVGHKDIVTLLNEMNKPHSKVLSFNKVFYEIKKKYGFNVARNWLKNEYDGHFYCHDSVSTSFIPYCYAYDLEDLVNNGLYFIEGFNHLPPKHLTSYMDMTIELISFCCNRSSGGIGLPNFLIYAYYFYKKDIEDNYFTKTPEIYRDQNLQVFIYRLNQPFIRSGTQSSFTTINIFDRPYIEAIFGGKEYPDGTFIIDYVDEIIEFQKRFMEKVSEIRAINMMTFPVLSFSLLYKDGKFIDEEFAKWACKHNMKWADSNFFVSEDVTSLSSCPLSPSTKILYYSERYKRYFSSEISEVFENNKDNNNEVIALNNGKRIKCKINKFNIPADYEITLCNGAKLQTTSNHLNKTYLSESVETKYLNTDDYLPFGMTPLQDSDNLTYEEGRIVGMFLGDGSYGTHNNIMFSLNNESKQDSIDFLYEYIPKHFGALPRQYSCKSEISGKTTCQNVLINSPFLYGLIKNFVIGDNALNKEISLFSISQSLAFRRGIIAGLYETDGGNSNRIYTSSYKLKESLILLFSTMGMVTNVTEDNRDGRMGTNPCYTIRYYTPNKSKTPSYIMDDNYMWIKIKSINKIANNKSKISYCLEVLDDNEPLFMLSNGIITHNCRLKNNIKDLGYFNSIGASALKVGSVKVNTINLARIAYETNTEDEYFNELKNKTLLCLQALESIRHIIERNIEKGLLPNYSYNMVELKYQYITIGLSSFYEAIQKFGYTYKDEFGYTHYTDDGIRFGVNILEVINEVKNKFSEGKPYKVNVEQVPAEKCASVLMEKDKKFFPNEEYELPLYGNQWIPLGVKSTIDEKIKLSSIFDEACGGGSICHINIDAPFNNFETAWDMLNRMAENKVPYHAINTKINACSHNHGFYGSKCPICGESPVTTYSRIVGFLVPYYNYSKERKEEFNLRDWHKIEN